MDRWSAWHILHGHIQPPKGEDLTLEIEDWKHGLSTAADTIAAQHEEEVAELRGQLSERRTICEAAQEEAARNFVDLKLAQDEVAQVRARVAAMTTALQIAQSTFHYCENGSNPEKPAQIVRDALSAAPKVWGMQGRTSKYYDLEVVAEDAPDEFRQLLIGRGMFAAWDVIVCPPKGEQPTESEQED